MAAVESEGGLMPYFRVHYKDPKLGKQVYVADAMKTAPSGVVELHSGSGMSHSQTVVVIGAGAFHVIERFEKEEE